jgi:thiamine biosynthesis lipoprotein
MSSRILIFIFLAVPATALALGWAVHEQSHSSWTLSHPAKITTASPLALSGPAMGSTWTVRLLKTPGSLSPDQVQAAVQEVLDRVESQMSTYRPNSDLSQFNRSRGTDWFSIPSDFATVANVAKHASEQSGGAFDVTVGPLVNLWGFGPDHPAGAFGSLPSDSMIDEARQHVGYQKLDVRLSPPAIRKADPLAYVDLSAIAKGYAAELVGHRLEELGAKDYLVLVGGEVRSHGVSRLGRPWRVGIETPTPGVRRVLYTVELKDQSLSTSGDYRNFFDAGGHRYCHEIDPATGRPSTRAPASVSVAHASGAYADAMATALMVLGRDEGYALAQRLNLAALFILRGDGHFETRVTPRFKALLIPTPDPTAR